MHLDYKNYHIIISKIVHCKSRTNINLKKLNYKFQIIKKNFKFINILLILV